MSKKDFMWANLVLLGSNMWTEEGNTKGREHRSNSCASPVLRFERDTWDKYMEYQRINGVNTIIIDIGEAMFYESHPELAVEGSFTHDQMRAEIAKLRAMGFEVVPKLNFSATHDIWLKDYSRMLSTPIYYQVCKDIINEVCDVFKPKYFHIGMDEENAELQRNFYFAAVRQGELWWHDLYYLVDCVEKNNVRAWIWADRIWSHPDEFVKKMPKSVLCSCWYYNGEFQNPQGEDAMRLKGYEDLDKHGFDQVPTGSNWGAKDNFVKLTKYCAEKFNPDLQLGMMQTAWERITEPWMPQINHSVDMLREAREWYENR